MKNRLKELLVLLAHVRMTGEADEEELTPDVALLCSHIFRLRDMVLNVNKNILNSDSAMRGHDDLCPVCASCCWGRPRLPDDSGMDFTRRQCSTCYEIRPEPKEE